MIFFIVKEICFGDITMLHVYLEIFKIGLVMDFFFLFQL